ncbi:uncharacterized protein K460DRAFT_164966 [Cucurbitaria berberidis CBS 394.84]|uniref:Amidohydrolase-related domain-containing protein n=1 Tax=Cucurbitaria berberidis CBS 394.84 TaxID=1168544 RepID=A0A9P4L4H2_9PLEO|nr:uncharacterized protein K460DRAFT_164966 [Cucurbitaria berberidis CBS 394.84]KAF1841312.1 hypothetical protein K460DRAFT_164966 [Cucurbitaria berberidis CBS 394.84]
MATPATPTSLQDRIYANAQRDDIDITALPFHEEALDYIAALSPNASTTPAFDFTNASRIDTHTHPVPPWFRVLEPLGGGRETPSWNASAHLQFMSEHQIVHSVLTVSTPQANAFNTELDLALRKKKTVALARLLNEFSAELCRLYPTRFSWLAITPLPYVDEAVREVRYALELGAIGVGILANHEGLYPGEGSFDPLWKSLQERAERSHDGREVVFVHPTEPVIRLEEGRLVNSKPSPLRSGLGEFYFETARALSSITANRTIIKFPNLHWRVSHGAGAFPDISERFLLGFTDVQEEARKVYRERFWYDSAGPVWPKQVKGLTEGMGVPVSQFVFGTDYPYGIGFWDVDVNIAGLADAELLSSEEKEQVFWRNARGLWGGKIPDV